MDQSTLCCVLLLPLCLCFDSEVTLEKTIGREPDVTQICPNQTLSTILFVDCTIRREKSGEDCRLFYLHGGGFERGCNSSKFTLMQENQAVFLHLTSLTPVDRGIYSCVCSHNEGTDILHLNITVEEEEDASIPPSITSAPGVWNPVVIIAIIITIVVIITAVVSGFICRTKCHRNCSRSDATSGLSVCETPGSLDKDDPDDVYRSLQQPASDLYQTISYSDRNMETVHEDIQEIDEREADPSCESYENIQMKESVSL